MDKENKTGKWSKSKLIAALMIDNDNLKQTIEDLKEQLESSRVVYQHPEYEDIKITEADTTQWWAEEAEFFRQQISEKNKLIEQQESKIKELTEQLKEKG